MRGGCGPQARALFSPFPREGGRGMGRGGSENAGRHKTHGGLNAYYDSIMEKTVKLIDAARKNRVEVVCASSG